MAELTVCGSHSCQSLNSSGVPAFVCPRDFFSDFWHVLSFSVVMPPLHGNPVDVLGERMLSKARILCQALCEPALLAVTCTGGLAQRLHHSAREDRRLRAAWSPDFPCPRWIGQGQVPCGQASYWGEEETQEDFRMMPFPSLCWKSQQIFSDLHRGNLVGILKVKLTHLWAPLTTEPWSLYLSSGSTQSLEQCFSAGLCSYQYLWDCLHAPFSPVTSAEAGPGTSAVNGSEKSCCFQSSYILWLLLLLLLWRQEYSFQLVPCQARIQRVLQYMNTEQLHYSSLLWRMPLEILMFTDTF